MNPHRIMKPLSSLRHRSLAAAFAASLALVLPASADTVTWSQTGASTATSVSAPDDNMNWSVGANWSGGSVPAASDAIVFGDVTSDTSALSGVNGREIVHLDANFLGTAAGSLTLQQTTASFANTLAVIQDANADSDLLFQVGAVSVSSGSTFIYSGQQVLTATGRIRELTLGYGGTAVSNAGTMSLSFNGNNNNRYLYGYLSLADGGAFSNAGTFTLTLNSNNGQYAGGTIVNALLGDTTNTGSITISRNGSTVGASDNYAAARGGVEFASLHNATAASTFTFTANNATLLSTGAANPVIADRAANLVVVGALQNSGTFTINRTPLKSKTGADGNTDNDQSDSVSRTVTARFGSLDNAATGAFVVNHNNNATPLTTTSSTVETTVLGAATNAGWISLKGAATSTNGADGAILTRLVTQGGFSNTAGGIITVNGEAVLANTGAFSNANTQSSRSIQGGTRYWDTTGLLIESATAADATFGWATGVAIDTSAFAGTTAASLFTAENFTLGALALSTTNGAAYTLTGGADILVAGALTIGGKLDLGDWRSVQTVGGHGQTLFFTSDGDASRKSYVAGLLSDGTITADLASGYTLAVFANQAGDAYYIGVTTAAVPEPAATAGMAGAAVLLLVAGCRLRQSRRLRAKASRA